MLVDMHIHTTVSSPCSFIDPDGLIEWARRLGLDAICVTEHDEIEGALLVHELGRKKGFRVFRGIEIYTDLGDMLVFGLLEDASSWMVPFEELREKVDKAGGIIIPAHPCRDSVSIHDLLGPEKADRLLQGVDALEVLNGGSTRSNNALALEVAKRYRLPGIGGSDAHHLAQVGRCLTVFERELRDEDDLIAEIRQGRCEACYMEEVGSLSWPDGGWRSS
jgi:hypothetical protein